jgi:DNA-binding NtrC family response regulator
MLMVDDEPLTSELVTGVPQRQDFKLAANQSGDEARVMSEEQAPGTAAVPADVRMPGISNAEPFPNVMERFRTTSVLLMSAATGEKTPDPLIPFPAKPSQIATLRFLMTGLLARQRELVAAMRIQTEKNNRLATEQTRLVKELQSVAGLTRTRFGDRNS